MGSLINHNVPFISHGHVRDVIMGSLIKHNVAFNSDGHVRDIIMGSLIKHSIPFDLMIRWDAIMGSYEQQNLCTLS